MSLVLADRVRQTSTTTGSGTFTLDGSVTGFQSFSVIGDGNTTYYTIALDSQWEVGIGTYSAGTLTRDSVISSSTGSKIVFGTGTKDVFVSYPAKKSVNQDANNRVLIPYTSGVTDVGSLNVGNATSHTDSGVIAGFTASEPLYLYTSLQNTSTANTSYASYAVNDGGHTAYAELGINNSNYSYSAAGYPNNGFSTPLASFVESYGGPLVMGSWDNQKISFIVNGAVNTTDAMTINTNGSIAFNGQVGTAGQVLQSNATSAPTWINAATGTVTSVDATVPTFLSVTGGPITTSGTLAISYSGTALPIANGGTGQTNRQSAINALVSIVSNRRFLRGDGTNATMALIQAADVPTLNQDTTGTAADITATTNSTLTTLSALSLPGSQVSGNISGNAANVTGTVAIANGGTGTTTPSLVAGDNVTVSGSWPNQTVNSTYTGFKNRLINAQMQIAQRATSGTSGNAVPTTAPTYPSIDRWYAYATGATVTVARVAGSGANQYNLQATGAASVTAIGIGQRIEQLNCYDMAGSTATLSVNISNSLLTTVTWTASYATSANTWSAKTQIATGTFTVTSTLTNYSAQISIPAAATTGIEILFTVGAQTSGTWVIGNAQLEKGSTATSFDYRDYGRELILCQRYLPAFNATTADYPLPAIGQVYSTTQALIVYNFIVQPRVAPTGITVNNQTYFSLTQASSARSTTTALAFNNGTLLGGVMTATVASGLVAGNVTFLWSSNATAQILWTGCEL